MSYCRFGKESDIYIYSDIHGYICCMCCTLMPKTAKTIFTTGWEEGESVIFKDSRPPCSHCNGEGCPKCCMHHDARLYSYEAAIEHVREHIEAGDSVPDCVIERIKKDCRMDKYLSSGRVRRHRAKRSYWKKWHRNKGRRYSNDPRVTFYQDNPSLNKYGRFWRKMNKKIKDMRGQDTTGLES